MKVMLLSLLLVVMLMVVILVLESDGTLTYNPSTGKVTATGFVGTLTGDVNR